MDDPIPKFRPGTGLRIIGMTFVLIGAAAAIISWFLPISFGEGEFVNIGLAQRQMVVLISGIAVLLVGTTLFACGTIIAALAPPETSERSAE